MSASEFKIGPDYLNDAFAEAGINDVMSISKTPAGGLHLDTDLSSTEVIDKLIGALALLFGKLLRIRRQQTP